MQSHLIYSGLPRLRLCKWVSEISKPRKDFVGLLWYSIGGSSSPQNAKVAFLNFPDLVNAFSLPSWLDICDILWEDVNAIYAFNTDMFSSNFFTQILLKRSWGVPTFLWQMHLWFRSLHIEIMMETYTVILHESLCESFTVQRKLPPHSENRKLCTIFQRSNSSISVSHQPT